MGWGGEKMCLMITLTIATECTRAELPSSPRGLAISSEECRPSAGYTLLWMSNMWNGTQSVGECSSSTSLSSQQDLDDDRMIAFVLSEEYAKLDGGVARRLSNLAPVAHVPRINSYIPDLSDASLDHQRLLQRLNVYGLYEVKVSGDGNCQFRALSDQMYKSPEYHKHVRKDIVKQLKDYRSLYEGYVPMKYKRYYKKMAKSGEWGDHVTLQAAADKFAAKICLLTSFRDTCFIEIMPRSQAPKREFWLSFWSEVHYNSLYEIRDAPIPQKPKKKHWLF
ncbi:OVARIAN TUMOR DOMAIN-containing deubiquitinating enzyme 12 isoform X2 [Rhodamnia argentea]|uniref:OVARIAN TUMOR DOMAIN-containing deubiquitinating enzyme 12 isoform X2 n=2 Tax=Rhodamnia argentea TaxID=178133 RepID=A0ABM3GUA1_9MYRT|nr:OVARIAN TUMOR DOMAIN-containing deubiquitinating enzyme 12 isoform X2 [Rhodamnia argentea]